MFKSKTLLVGTILSALLFGGCYHNTQRGLSGNESQTASPEVKTSTEAGNKNMTAADLMAMLMKEAGTKKGTLLDVSGGKGSGMAYVLRKDGKLYLSLTAKLPDPKEGTFYEGWLVVKGSNPVKFFSTGKLTKEADGSYSLSYTSDQNAYEGYDFVVVTWEVVDDQKPEKHILEGMVQ
ncbi:anti-sigma factor [Candidatus Gottesmanbacteria bacterium]|nr:anti-sigma factor [Candidatus Gottesmanbacteria bacterium]